MKKHTSYLLKTDEVHALLFVQIAYIISVSRVGD